MSMRADGKGSRNTAELIAQNPGESNLKKLKLENQSKLPRVRAQFRLNQQPMNRPLNPLNSPTQQTLGGLKPLAIDFRQVNEVAARRGVSVSALTLNDYLTATHQNSQNLRAVLEKNGVSMNSSLKDVAPQLLLSYVRGLDTTKDLEKWIKANVPPLVLSLAAGAAVVVGGQTVTIVSTNLGGLEINVGAGVNRAEATIRKDF